MMMHRNCQTGGMQTRPGFSVWTFTTLPPLRGFQAVCTTREPRLLRSYYYSHIAQSILHLVQCILLNHMCMELTSLLSICLL